MRKSVVMVESRQGSQIVEGFGNDVGWKKMSAIENILEGPCCDVRFLGSRRSKQGGSVLCVRT